MRKTDTLVSIIVPMYNAERYVADTLASILSEQVVSIEVIVVNDGSTDRSLDRVFQFSDDRIRIIDGLGRGAARAMSTGYSAARGSIIMCCDSDDFYPASRIRQQVEWLNGHPEFDGVCGKYSTVDEKGNLVADMQCGQTAVEITDELTNGRLRTSYCTYAIRSTLAQKVGEFREFFSSAYDIDFQLRLGEAGRIGYVPENYYFYRIHSSSITHTQPNVTREFFEATAIELQRQRRLSGVDDLQRGCPPAKPISDEAAVHSATDHIQEQLIGRAWREHQVGEWMLAIRTGVRALSGNPLKIGIWRSVLALILKSPRKPKDFPNKS